MCLFVGLSMGLFWLFACLFGYLFVRMFACLLVFVCRPAPLGDCWLACVFDCLRVCLFGVRLFVRLCVCSFGCSFCCLFAGLFVCY